MKRMPPVYLDAHAGMPLLAEAAEAMARVIDPAGGLFANAASTIHRHGQSASAALREAARHVAAAFGPATRPDDLLWTSCATESIDVALRIWIEAAESRGSQQGTGPTPLPLIITFAAEHSATLRAAERLRASGRADCLLLPCDHEGFYSPDLLDETLRRERRAGRADIMVSALWAGNEVGTIQPVRRLGEVCLGHGAAFHVDATQAVPWQETEPSRVPGLGLLSAASHKMGGPPGAGVLWWRRSGEGALAHPALRSTRAQDLLRPGTLGLPAIVGFGAAAATLVRFRAEFAQTAQAQTRLLWALINESLAPRHRERLLLNGPPLSRATAAPPEYPDCAAFRLPNNLSFCVDGAAGQELYGHLAGKVSCSPASACRTSEGEASHVLLALGRTPEQAHATLRLGLWPRQPEEEIRRAAAAIAEAITRTLG